MKACAAGLCPPCRPACTCCWPPTHTECTADVRWLAGVHGDRDPATGLTLLFKPDTVPPGAELPVH